MPTVLDSLVLEFNLDATQFTREQQKLMDQMRRMEEQTTHHAVNIEAQVKKMAATFANLQRGALAVIGGFVGADVLKSIDNIAHMQIEVGNLARQMNMSESDVLKWGTAFKMMGADSQAGFAALKQMNDELIRFHQEGTVSGVGQVASQLGIRVYDSNNQLKSAQTVWVEIAAALDRLGKTGQDRYGFLLRSGASPETINFLMRSAGEIQQALAAARKAGGDLTPKDLAASREYVKNVEMLNASFGLLGRTIGNLVIPYLVSFAQSLNRLIGSWMYKPGSPEDIAQKTKQKVELNEILGGPRETLNKWTSWGGLKGGPLYQLGERLYGPGGIWEGGGQGNTEKDYEAYLKARDVLRGPDPAVLGDNWAKWLKSQSYLETDVRNIGNPTSSAQGYFQFLKGTAEKAMRAGIPDPRVGTYDQQAAATKKYIQQFYPQAAAAIERGDFSAAVPMLRGEWPSLPGGSQPQSMSRYSDWWAIQHGQQTSKPIGPQSLNFHIENMNINGDNAREVASNLKTELNRQKTAILANSSLG